MLCLLRTILHAVYTIHDSYLLANACAILYNLSPFTTTSANNSSNDNSTNNLAGTTTATGMHAYTSERLVKVVCQLSKRAIRAVHKKQQQQQIYANSIGSLKNIEVEVLTSNAATAGVKRSLSSEDSINVSNEENCSAAVDNDLELLPSAIAALMNLLDVAIR